MAGLAARRFWPAAALPFFLSPLSFLAAFWADAFVVVLSLALDLLLSADGFLATEVDAFLRAGLAAAAGAAFLATTIVFDDLRGDLEDVDRFSGLPFTADGFEVSFALEALLLSFLAVSATVTFLATEGAFFCSLRADCDLLRFLSGTLEDALATTGFTDCLTGDTLFLGAVFLVDGGATDLERREDFCGAAGVALFFAFSSLALALRAAFSSRLRWGAAAGLATLWLRLRTTGAAGFGAGLDLATVTLLLTLGGLAIFLSF